MWGLKTKMLQKYGTDITRLAETVRQTAYSDRKREGDRASSLLKRRNSNACLVGEAGVGKTAIVEALALKIARGSVPDQLKGKKIFSIGVGGTVDEERVKVMLEEVRGSEGALILFIEDLHNFIKDDRIATILKLALSKEHFRCIGAIRVEEYTAYIERDEAINHMFEIIRICEPSRKDCIKIVEGMIHKYHNHHGVEYTKLTPVSAVDLSKHYFRELRLPRKAIDLIDEAGARACMLRKIYVTEAEIEHVVSMRTGVRVETSRLLQLEDILKRRIVGQDEAVAAVCRSIRMARLEMRAKETRPTGCFLFTGPTGVGKTEMAKVLAEEYFGSREAVVSLDTHKLMEHHIVSRLVGKLADEVRRRPHSLVLFDEIEKAHEKVLDVVLLISKSGRLSDGEGKSVDFSNAIVVITSSGSDTFEAEMVNKFDQVMVFKPLEEEHIEKISKIMIERFRAKVFDEKKIQVIVSKRLKESLLVVGFGNRYCCWGLKRAFATSVEAKLGDEILCERVAQGDTVTLDITLTGDVECQRVSRLEIIQHVSQPPVKTDQPLAKVHQYSNRNFRIREVREGRNTFFIGEMNGVPVSKVGIVMREDLDENAFKVDGKFISEWQRLYRARP